NLVDGQRREEKPGSPERLAVLRKHRAPVAGHSLDELFQRLGLWAISHFAGREPRGAGGRLLLSRRHLIDKDNSMAETVARTLPWQEIARDVLVMAAACEEPREIGFRAGQFLSVRCGPADAANPERRSYSILSRPERRTGFELLVKLLPHGVGSELFAAL